MILIIQGRLAFPSIYHAKQFDGAGPFSYSASILVEPDSADAAKVDAAIQEVAKNTWGAKSDAILKTILGNNQKCCWYPGELKAYESYQGKMVFSSKRAEEDGPVDIVDARLKPLLEASGKPYSGSHVKLKVDLWAQKNQYGNGIRSTLIAVQFLRDGEAFSSVGPANHDGFVDESSAEDAGDGSGLELI